MRGHAALSLIVLLAGCQAGTSADGAGLPAAPGQCVAHEVGRTRLALPGTAALYVEPETFVRGEDGVLLAGSPVYRFDFDSAGEPALAPDPGLLGVILRDDGSVRPVPRPVDESLAGVRGIWMPEGGWGVAFTLVDSVPGQSEPEPVAHRFGVFDGREWGALEDVEPGAGVGYARTTSDLVLGEGTVWWSIRPVDGQAHPWIMTRGAAGWVGQALPVPAARVVLASGARIAAVTRADARPGETDTNSLFIWRREADWEPLRRIVRGGEEPVFSVQIASEGSWTAFGWTAATATNRARVIRDALVEAPEVVDLGPLVSSLRWVPGSARKIWLFDHPLQGGASELRMVHVEEEPTVLLALPNPYRGPFRVVALRPGRLLVTGPLLEPDPGRLSSLQIELSLDCGAPD